MAESMEKEPHGWTMLKPQPNSSTSTTYCYVHPGDPETSDGDSNVHLTKIQLGNGVIPSHIKVDVVPRKKASFELWYNVLVVLLLIASYVLLTVLYLELKATKEEIRALESVVKSLGRGSDEFHGSKLFLRADAISQNEPMPNVDLATTTQPPPLSSTERDKREVDVFSNHGFPLLAHFKGGLPESVINEGAGDIHGDVGYPGLISPWFKDRTAAGEFALKNTTSKEAKGSVIVPESGLYFIYAQVFYLTRNFSNSYSITLFHEIGHETILATCSSPPNELSESSCYTATARALKKGDRLQLRQRERKRHILLRQGQTFLGLVLLSPSPNSP